MKVEMKKEKVEFLEKIATMQEELTQLQVEYWHQYSHLGTWQFWVILFLFVAPLISLFFLLDRKRILLLGFFGFNIHVWFSYINIWGVKQVFWEYPHELLPFLPGNLALDAALIPAVFMLVYQWVLNNNKNFYLYMIGLSLFLAFGFKPLIVMHNLFVLHKGINYLHLFIAYCVIFFVSKMITNVFLKLLEDRKGY